MSPCAVMRLGMHLPPCARHTSRHPRTVCSRRIYWMRAEKSDEHWRKTHAPADGPWSQDAMKKIKDGGSVFGYDKKKLQAVVQTLHAHIQEGGVHRDMHTPFAGFLYVSRE